MRRLTNCIYAAMIAGSVLCLSPGIHAQNETRVRVYEDVVFYDGYNGTIFGAEENDGVLRFRNSLYSVKLDTEKLKEAQGNLRMEVVIGALCDNYDRIGNVNLAFVPKGQESYEVEKVDRIEITRFITPFMNKNKKPDEVPYEYDIPNVSHILRDTELNSQYDFWLEFELFGIPYAANQQVQGCAGRNDVFDGTIDFVFNPKQNAGWENGNVLVPIYIKTPEHYGNINLNNYNKAATDTIGVTTRTFEFEVPKDVNDARIYLILTNHGAGNGGEEYVRRQHLVYYDGDLVLSYKPGGVSCEPYRKYNTQPNGIYGSFQLDSYWKSWSNWCPGQAVPIREIHLGAVKKGKHSVMIRVPDAKFMGEDGDFRPSLYFHGLTEGTLEASVDQIWFEGPGINVEVNDHIVSYSSDEPVAYITVHSFDGKNVTTVAGSEKKELDLRGLQNGAYILTFFTEDGRSTGKKVIL